MVLLKTGRLSFKYGFPAGAKIGVLAKIESADSVGHLEEILDAVDGAMVARGDLGAELPVEEVSKEETSSIPVHSRTSKRCKSFSHIDALLHSKLTHLQISSRSVLQAWSPLPMGIKSVCLEDSRAFCLL